MSLEPLKVSLISPLTTLSGPSRSRLLSELLDANHDAWHVGRKGHSWSFYREIGHEHPLLPFGSVVLTTAIGKPQTFDFYSGRGKRSLLTTYGEEVAHATQTLTDREYVISLFTTCAREPGASTWDHRLRFCGDHLTERCVSLRYGTAIYDRIVGAPRPQLSRLSIKHERLVPPRIQAGLFVSQHDNDVPMARCLISYPRTIEATFFSSRLRAGLEAITGNKVSLIAELNRSAARRGYLDESDF